MSRLWIYLRLIHIIVDLLGLYASFVLAYFVRVGWIFSTDFPFAPFAWVATLSVIIWSGFLLLTKYYRIPPRSGQRVAFDIFLALLGGALGIGILIVTYFFKSELFFSRLLNIYAFGFGFIWLMISQFVFRRILASIKKQEKQVYRTLIVGANRVAEKIITAICKNPYAPYKIVGVIDPYGLAKKVQGSQIMGKLDKLETVCEREKITALIQCDAFEHTLNLISFCEEKNIKFQFDPALRGIFEENLRIREVAGQTMISFVQRDYTGSKKMKFCFIDFILRQVFDVD
ncbi:hypothetical protein K9M41_02780 [Candidatus Gracilibacteria bacterium]|nr:hypothetical protein [Candidatus Gracilibacteria bacterium]